ncbi:threonine synthase, partial [Streptococcus anginosus]|nr:threonine synthase [Streptococcus anginosus]
ETMSKLSYQELAFQILSLYFDDFPKDILQSCIQAAYDEKFDDDRIAPVVGVSDHYLLELFHGPTIAFKDMALSLLPHLMKAAQKVLGRDEEIIILTATSGDTGKAAMAGFEDVTGTKIIVFYPKG